MAYGLIYNLNFASNIGDRKHRISIYKDGHTATITTSDNNIIGTEEPVVLLWDNKDDIYNNIMASRLEINLYTDSVKQIDIDDLLSSTQNNKFKVEYYIEGALGVMQKYWEGYINNSDFEGGISSTPTKYKIIATDLLTTLKNVLTTDGTAVTTSKASVIKYINNVLGFLPYNVGFKVNNDIQIAEYGTTNFQKMHLYQWVSAVRNGFELAHDNAFDYIENTLKCFNSRLFYADDSYYIVNNCTYPDSATFEVFDSSGDFLNNTTTNVVKTIPTNLKPLSNDLSIRYETPFDVVDFKSDSMPYASDFDIGFLESPALNLTPYPSFEEKVNGILFNGTYYSDDYSVITNSQVKVGNYSIKTQNLISSGTPTQKILDTGFQGAFQENTKIDGSFVLPAYFHASFFVYVNGDGNNDVTLYYSLLRETADNQAGTTNLTRSYYNGLSWATYTNESDATKLPHVSSSIAQNTWIDISEEITVNGTQPYARYRIILWQPKATFTTNRTIHFDQVLLSRRDIINVQSFIGQPTGDSIGKISGSTRRNKTLNYEIKNFYPVSFLTLAKSTNYTPTGFAQLNQVITQHILNDQRSHIRRYTITCTPQNNSEIIYPYHKIDIDFSNYSISETCLIDRLTYKAKSNIYEIEFHETKQATNASVDVSIL